MPCFDLVMGGYDGILLITNDSPSWGLVCSLTSNQLGPEGGKAIGEALEVNQSVTNFK